MASRLSLALMAAALAVGAAACGATGETKAGSKLAASRTLTFDLPPPSGPPGTGGDFTGVGGRTPAGFPPGTGFIIWNTLAAPGVQLELIYCVVAREHPRSTFWCTRTYVLAAGQIVATGDYDNSPSGDVGTIPIVGGTGAYEGARGTVTSTNGFPYVTIRLR